MDKDLKIERQDIKIIKDPKATGKLILEILNLCKGHTCMEIEFALDNVLNNVKSASVFQEVFTDFDASSPFAQDGVL